MQAADARPVPLEPASAPAGVAARSGFVPCDAGLRLYWRAVGTGPAIICCNGVGVSTFFWRYVVEHFCRDHTVVVWDYRGHGRSEDPPSLDDCDLSMQACARDLGRVAREVGAERAVLLGHSMGCQVILERWRQEPASVAGLVPMLGSAGRIIDTFYDTSMSRYLFALAWRLSEAIGPRVNDLLRPLLVSPLPWFIATATRQVDPYYTRRDDFQPYLDHLARIDARLFLRMARAAQEHDAFPWLSRVDVPTLVIGAEYDRFTPLWISRRIAASIPGAELLVLGGGTHAAIIEQPKTINHRIERFLRERVREDDGRGR